MYPQKVPAGVPGTVHWFWSEIANFLVPSGTWYFSNNTYRYFNLKVHVLSSTKFKLFYNFSTFKYMCQRARARLLDLQPY